MTLTRRKPLAVLLDQASHSDLKRTLTATSLVALGIGAVIGAGIFVRTAAAATEAAGPAVTVSFIIAALGCAFAGLCYAEFAAMIPIAGSAYTYAYTTMGEFVAWIIGWALVLEYALGAATLSISWAEYLNKLLNWFGMSIPYQWCHSPMETSMTTPGLHGIINIPAVIILLLLSLVLIKGTQESATLNAIIVAVKVSIVIAFVAVGWHFINPANHIPFTIPANTPGHEGFFKHGWGGVVGGAGIVFFAFIGFDAVSTAAQEAKNPARDMPIGIMGSLAICTLLYITFGYVITGVANWREFAVAGKEASVAYAVQHHMPGFEWLALTITIAILAGFSSVMLVMLLGQSRVFYSMSKDGLLPRLFSDVHPRFRTPYKSNVLLFFFVGAFGAFLPESVAGDLTSIGTLFAFMLVSIGVWIMRHREPHVHRPFRTPLVPVVPILAVIICGGMIISLDHRTQLAALSWMIIGLFIYFLYSRKHSLLNQPPQAVRATDTAPVA
ncbi:MAG TPA: amino acid permease [Bryobacteraceae bacterium]|jgi:APA family basic amino acid/polyamine antiporter|nr:amino acid permease [Bryobacteraceae bacterium]